MAEREQIQLNYRKTLQQADELESMAEKLKTLSIQKGENAVCGIKNAWDSESADEYYRKGERLTLLMKQRGDTLRKAAEVLRRAAKNTYYAEMRSVEIAEKRGYR